MKKSNEDEPSFIKGKPKDIESEGKLSSFRLTIHGDKDSALNTVVTDGNGGLKVQQSNTNVENKVPLYGEVIEIHEGQHLKDYLKYASNLSILKGQPADLLIRVPTSIINTLERRAYRAGFNHLQKKLENASSYKERLPVEVAIWSFGERYKKYVD